jgi:hypothetical protein
MHYPNIGLLKDAQAIIEGVPDQAFSLQQWRLQQGPSLLDGTICCAAGWLTLHPQFAALGLDVDGGGRPAFGLYRGYAALGALFSIDTEEAYRLFCPVDPAAWSSQSDKAVWLNRLRTYLARNAHKYPH